MLMDAFLPEFEEAKRYSIHINASPEVVFEAIKRTDFLNSKIIWFLFSIRSIPSIVTGKFKFHTAEPVTIQSMEKSGFVFLGETPNEELVIGVVGPFWKLTGNICKDVSSDSFLAFNRPGNAKAVWNFMVKNNSSGTELSTETRIHCLDKKSLQSFKRYWFFVGYFSGVIRNVMLKMIKRSVERT